ncbi:MAG: hypothetical protein O2854_07610 [Chloroflexi bacterium]|nr:hypothetical protein [Chloroflexota bacterium]
MTSAEMVEMYTQLQFAKELFGGGGGVSWIALGLIGALAIGIVLSAVVFVTGAVRKGINKDNIAEDFAAVNAKLAQLTAKNG